MTNEKILKKAIEKVVKNGYKNLNVDDVFPVTMSKMEWEGFSNFLIFSHGFAKAFWGEEEACGTAHEAKDFVGGYCDKQMWQYHLAQMVLEKEPLKYIEKFL